MGKLNPGLRLEEGGKCIAIDPRKSLVENEANFIVKV